MRTGSRASVTSACGTTGTVSNQRRPSNRSRVRWIHAGGMQFHANSDLTGPSSKNPYLHCFAAILPVIMAVGPPAGL